MSKNFEQWKALAALTSKEQDPAKLTQLANEMNRVLTQKAQYLDPPPREPLEYRFTGHRHWTIEDEQCQTISGGCKAVKFRFLLFL